MGVLPHRERQPRLVAHLGRRPADGPLHYLPPVVLAAFDDVDLLPCVLPDVRRPQPPVGRIEAEAPGVPETPGEDFLAEALRAPHEGVVLRDGVRQRVDIYSEDASQKRRAVLPGALRVVRTATVADGDVEETIRPETDLPAVVIAEGLVDIENVHLAPDQGRVGPLGIRLDSRRPCLSATVADRVIHKVETVAGKLRMKRQSQQSFLTAETQSGDPVQEHSGSGNGVGVFKHQNTPRLLDHEQAVAAITGVLQIERPVENQVAKRHRGGKARAGGHCAIVVAARRQRVTHDQRGHRRRSKNPFVVVHGPSGALDWTLSVQSYGRYATS